MEETWSNFNEYPHKVFASVLLLDGKIYNWKIKNSAWLHPSEVKMRYSDFDKIDRMEVKWTSFTVNDRFEHSLAFQYHAVEWFKQFEISEHKIGGAPYKEE